MKHIYDIVKKKESIMDNRDVVAVSSNDKDFPTTEKYMFLNYFDWFSVSVYNFCREIGKLSYAQKNKIYPDNLYDEVHTKGIKDECKQYISLMPEIIENVILWRNKVGAHFAGNSPRSEDSRNTREYSITSSLSKKNGRIYPMSNHNGEQPHDLPLWSITEVYEYLVTRYPNCRN